MITFLLRGQFHPPRSSPAPYIPNFNDQDSVNSLPISPLSRLMVEGRGLGSGVAVGEVWLCSPELSHTLSIEQRLTEQ